mmetsp:Transcript_27713/g.73137  ORF Transcript_27713/g.73137 Transcript_27713/m.73137 type:complete len:403 (+) Transcript_27713:96-1304(+)
MVAGKRSEKTVHPFLSHLLDARWLPTELVVLVHKHGTDALTEVAVGLWPHAPLGDAILHHEGLAQGDRLVPFHSLKEHLHRGGTLRPERLQSLGRPVPLLCLQAGQDLLRGRAPSVATLYRSRLLGEKRLLRAGCGASSNSSDDVGHRLQIICLRTQRLQLGQQISKPVRRTVVSRQTGFEAVRGSDACGGRAKVQTDMLACLQPRQHVSCTDIRKESDVRFGHREHGFLGRDADGRVEREANPSTHHNAVPQRNLDDVFPFIERRDAVVELVLVVEKLLRQRGPIQHTLADLCHISSSAQRTALSPQHHAANTLGSKTVVGVREIRDHLPGQGIQLLRPAQCNLRDAVCDGPEAGRRRLLRCAQRPQLRPSSGRSPSNVGADCGRTPHGHRMQHKTSNTVK